MEATILIATKVARSPLNSNIVIMEQALQDGVNSTFELQYFVDEFEKMSLALEKAYNVYVSILEESELDEAIEEMHTFKLNKQKSKFKVMSKLQSPRIELLHFDGDILNWKPFKESFMIHIHNKVKMSATTKMTRLIGLLEGEAAEMVKGLSLMAQSYEDAW